MRILEDEMCCGCGNCSLVCSKKAVTLQLDNEGFLMPIVDDSKCVKCGKCFLFCPVLNQKEELKTNFGIQAYYGIAKDKKTLATTTSGGVATLLSKEIIKLGGVVYGCSYINSFQDVEIRRATAIDELDKFKGSKYVQANKGDIFHSIKNDLENGIQTLFIGLPCEIAALKVFLKRKYDNLYTVDLVCHGPTSTYALRDYVKRYSKERPDLITEFSMRYKNNDKWTPYYIYLKYNNGKIHKEIFWGSDFGFVFGRFGRKSCYQCSFKAENKYSDITLGDAWGADKDIIKNNNTGISAIIINTVRGVELLKRTQSIQLIEANLDRIVYGNPNLVKTRELSSERKIISSSIKKIGLHKTVCKLKPIKRRIRDTLYNIKVGFLLK